MKSIQTYRIASMVVGTWTIPSSAATTLGSVGDGRPSLYYVALSGEFGVQPDGQPIGLLDIQSVSGIFMANATFPPGGLGLDVNTANRISWAALPNNAFLTNSSLGRIAPRGLSQDFLLNDLTITFSRGFGTPHVIPDLVYTIPEPAAGTLFALAIACVVAGKRHRPSDNRGRGGITSAIYRP